MESLSAVEARRVALAAQGFADPRPSGRVDRRHGRRLFDRIGVIQIDSVNVLVRSQELPVFARLGAHPRSLLPSMLDAGELFEYWAHAASLVPTAHYHLHRWRMEKALRGELRVGIETMERERPGYLELVLSLVRERGPVSAGDIREVRDRKRQSWWDWDHTKRALEILFSTGQVSARRTMSFERRYDLAERVIPAAVLARPAPAEADARKELLVLAAKSMGVATDKDLADYHHQKVPIVRPLLTELVEEGRLLPVTVPHWPGRVYLHPAARVPRRVDVQALVSPFDSMVWNRERTERLFDVRYRIEIYVPAPKRIYGYYVLPFLLGEDMVGLVDLKADRAAGVLRVQAAHAEPGEPPGEIVGPLAEELTAMAGWLGLGGVAVAERGDLSRPLAAALRSPG